MTEKLYYKNSHLKEFRAVVTACEPYGDLYHISLNQTAFFPEGGGQAGDTGTLNDIEVLDTHEKNNIIRHYTKTALEPGTEVTGCIDWEKRFSRMQQHSAEHIVSGLIHGRFGYDNVGFHLGEKEVTLDFNGSISKEDLAEIEILANQTVWANLPVQITYPSPEALNALDYRSKIEIAGQVRIVTIPGIDVCACCAPHVDRTGEIGLIKLTNIQAHRGGVRIHLLAGNRALEDYREKEKNIKSISIQLSAKEDLAAQAVEHLKQENYTLTGRLMSLQKAVIQNKAAAVPPDTKDPIFFETGIDMDTAREFVNLLMKKCTGIVSVFAENGTEGFRYILGSTDRDVRPLCKKLNQAFQGRGGGKPEMVQGSLKAKQSDIRKLLSLQESAG